MAYKALYRTYRPQTFEEVAGQRHIVKTLRNALKNNKIAHAYLFAGPRGTGKTTMAKLFAKALNCEHGVGEQCNECSNCQEIIEGSHPDVIEIDAASNNGVEQVRELIDKVNYLPIKGRYKVYIIDEVHMMTTNAFNALLKTLEEPPAFVVFILATTEPHNILPTIISRCQRYDFTKVSDDDIEAKLKEILEKEHVEYEEEALKAIVSLADGGVRDALSILDQILAYSGNTLEEDDVYTLFGLTSKDEKINFVKSLVKGDASRCLNKIQAFAQGGVDIKRFVIELIEIFKDILIYKKTSESEELSVISEEDALELSELIDANTLNKYIDVLLKGQMDFKYVNNAQTLFEIMTLKMCTIDDVNQPTNIVKSPQKPQIQPKIAENLTNEKIEINHDSERIEPIIPPVSKVEVQEPKQADIIIEKHIEKEQTAPIPDWLLDDEPKNTTVSKEVIDLEGETNSLEDDIIIKLMVLGNKDERKQMLLDWKQLDAQLNHPQYGDIIALILDGKPFIVSKDAVVLEYDFEKLAKRANIKSNQSKLSTIFSKYLKRDIFVYAISRAESVRLINSYHNLRQISQLPKSSSINLDFSKYK